MCVNYRVLILNKMCMSKMILGVKVPPISTRQKQTSIQFPFKAGLSIINKNSRRATSHLITSHCTRINESETKEKVSPSCDT